jgi:adenylate cyclase
MLSPRTRRNLLRIIPFGVIWLVTGWLFLAIEFAAVKDTSDWAGSAIRMDLSIFIFASIAVTFVGLLVGLIEIKLVGKLFASMSFGQKILYKVILYAVFFSVVMLFAFPIAASLELDTGLFQKAVWDRYLEFLTSKTHFSTMMQMGASLLISLFYAEIGENVGHRALLNFFTGKYHRPRDEERIFMFLDMKSSTSIAEQLGHHTYFRFLRAYYADLSDAIIDHDGEVYQYAGDEIIITWALKDKKENTHCIRCFFEMREALLRRNSWYLKNFGLVPSFKAGLHCGMVTTGEIGEIRKQIFFTSDVLNATARIQGLCNSYDVDILISRDLLEQLDPGDTFKILPIGETELRGKQEHVELFSVEVL